MKKIIFLAIASLLAVTATAQQLKTAQGITTITTIEKPKKPKKPKKPNKTFAPIERGFEQSVEVNIGSDADYLIVGANYTAGYRFNNYIFAGGGAGLNFWSQGGSAIIPIYANVRGYFMKTRLKPFASLSIGTDIIMYNLDNMSRSEYWADLHLATNVGASYRLTDKLDCQISLGYRFINGNCQFITVNMGVTF
ncbi:MAG: hypothetical protein J6K33_06390 [Alistipes sp.]|nr:hypothetical protein [Alistipes sp.]